VDTVHRVVAHVVAGRLPGTSVVNSGIGGVVAAPCALDPLADRLVTHQDFLAERRSQVIGHLLDWVRTPSVAGTS
jgi:hypothetical protein